MSRRRDEFTEFDLLLIEPPAVGLLLSELVLDLTVVFEFPGRGVGGNHLARAEPAFADDGRVIEDHSACLRADVEDAIVSDLVAGWAEAIAVERGAKLGAIGENQPCRSVPRLGKRTGVLIERAQFVGNRLVIPVSRRHQHAHRMLGRAPGKDQQLQRMIERGGVRFAMTDEVFHQFDVVAPHR